MCVCVPKAVFAPPRFLFAAADAAASVVFFRGTGAECSRPTTSALTVRVALLYISIFKGLVTVQNESSIEIHVMYSNVKHFAPAVCIHYGRHSDVQHILLDTIKLYNAYNAIFVTIQMRVAGVPCLGPLHLGHGPNSVLPEEIHYARAA